MQQARGSAEAPKIHFFAGILIRFSLKCKLIHDQCFECVAGSHIEQLRDLIRIESCPLWALRCSCMLFLNTELQGKYQWNVFTLICYKYVDDCNSSLSFFHGVVCGHNLLASVVGLGGVNVEEFVPKLVVYRALSQGWATPSLSVDWFFKVQAQTWTWRIC